MGPEVRIWDLRLGFAPQGWDMSFKGGRRTEEKKKKEKEEKITNMGESIGHQPLWGHWPKRGEGNYMVLYLLILSY